MNADTKTRMVYANCFEWFCELLWLVSETDGVPLPKEFEFTCLGLALGIGAAKAILGEEYGK